MDKDMSEITISVNTSAGSVGDQENRKSIMWWYDTQVGVITPQSVITMYSASMSEVTLTFQ